MGNKLFVIGGLNALNCEVFDSFFRKFSLIEAKLPKLNPILRSVNIAVCIGKIILNYNENYSNGRFEDTILYIYDVQKNHWSEKSCSVLKNLGYLSCVKYYFD